MSAATAPSGSADPFRPEGIVWTRVSPRLALARRVTTAITLGVLSVPGAVLALVFGPWWWVWPATGVLLYAWSWRLIGRQVPAWGYAEREDDLLVRHGVMYRRLLVVPYGRMQYVEVDSGPIARRLGLASVQLHTASPATDAAIPGLPAAEAARLRDRLSSLGESRLAGL
ncbi:MAG: PH domain-containing protein [Kineosporiaceae bacterium]